MWIEFVEFFLVFKEFVILVVYGFYKNFLKKIFFRVIVDLRGMLVQNFCVCVSEENDCFL